MSDETRPEPDRVPGAPHPRETAILFGQDAAQDEFLKSYVSGRLHSGWLITGPRGVGKATLAWKLATFLLSEPLDDAGGLFGEEPMAPTSLEIDANHPTARLVRSGAHPGLYVIRRPFDEKAGKLKTEITLDAVRGLKNFFHMSAADGGRRVVIVDAADELNRNAANAILKELEEPPVNTTILLVTHQPSGILPTIRSRCRELRLKSLSSEDMARALAQADVEVAESEALTVLSAGSAGEAIRLINHDGLPLYAELVSLFSNLPRVDRQNALVLANSCAGKGAEYRFPLLLDLIDLFLARVARAGLQGEPHSQAAMGEARLLARLCSNDISARKWASLQQELGQRARHGRAVNLDPASLILDMIFKIERAAHSVAA